MFRVRPEEIDDPPYRGALRMREHAVVSRVHHVLVVDDILEFPMLARWLALATEYEPRGSRPWAGRNGLAPYPENVRTALRRIMGAEVSPFSRTFRANDVFDPPPETQIHVDDWAGRLWAMTVYLSPIFPQDAGTEFYEERATGAQWFCRQTDLRAVPPSHYAKLFTIPMRFNRAAIYNGRYLHTASRGFGDNPASARLIYSLFFKVKI